MVVCSHQESLIFFQGAVPNFITFDIIFDTMVFVHSCSLRRNSLSLLVHLNTLWYRTRATVANLLDTAVRKVNSTFSISISDVLVPRILGIQA